MLFWYWKYRLYPTYMYRVYTVYCFVSGVEVGRRLSCVYALNQRFWSCKVCLPQGGTGELKGPAKGRKWSKAIVWCERDVLRENNGKFLEFGWLDLAAYQHGQQLELQQRRPWQTAHVGNHGTLKPLMPDCCNLLKNHTRYDLNFPKIGHFTIIFSINHRNNV